MQNPSSHHSIAVHLSCTLLRALGIALVVVLLSAAASAVWGQETCSGCTSNRWQPVRGLEDDATGTKWLLERDTAHPGAPGRLRRITIAGRLVAGTGALNLLAAVASPVIRSGDRVVVEEETRVLSARLDAVALAPARPNEHFKARLALGGKTVDVIALASGRAKLAPDMLPNNANKGAGQ